MKECFVKCSDALEAVADVMPVAVGERMHT